MIVGAHLPARCTPALHPLPPAAPGRPLAPGEFTHAFTALKTIVATEGRRGVFAG